MTDITNMIDMFRKGPNVSTGDLRSLLVRADPFVLQNEMFGVSQTTQRLAQLKQPVPREGETKKNYGG